MWPTVSSNSCTSLYYRISRMDLNTSDVNVCDNTFVITAYKHISKISEKNNVLMSTLAIEILLKLIILDAKNKSAATEELRTILGQQEVDDKKVRQTIRKAIDVIQKSDENYRLNLLNKMYVEEGSDVNEVFKKATFEVFGVHTETVDFTDAEGTKKRINKWLSTETNDIVNNLTNPEVVVENTKSILANALYFEADWKSPFLKPLTIKRPFTKNDDEVIQTETLVGYIHCNYYEIEEINATLVELPFKDDKATLVIALPNEKNGLADIEKKLEVVLGVKSSDFKKELVRIFLPKFKILAKINFKNVLKQMGVDKFFEDSGVGDIFQKLCLEVGEEGARKNAADPVDEKLKSLFCFMPPPWTKMLDVAHPFLFYIKIHDFILLVGRVYDPTSCDIDL